MADRHEYLGQTPHEQRLPSFEALRTSLTQPSSTSSQHSSQSHNSRPEDSTSMLGQRLQAQDQTISALRHECERRQTLYEQLETKSHLMDRQIADLNDERADLRNQATILANQVDNLTREREQFQHQTQVDAAQWRQIMAMSSQLQMKSVEETRRFNTDREAWAAEKAQLEQRLMDFQIASSRESESEDAGDALPTLRRTRTIPNMSTVQMREVVAKLQTRCVEMEDLLTSLLKESASIERTGVILRMAKKRIGQNDRVPLFSNSDDEES